MIAGQKLKYALISGRAASLYLRWHNRLISHPRRGSRVLTFHPSWPYRRGSLFGAVLSGDTFRNAHNLSTLYSAGSNSWKESVTVGTDAKSP